MYATERLLQTHVSVSFHVACSLKHCYTTLYLCVHVYVCVCVPIIGLCSVGLISATVSTNITVDSVAELSCVDKLSRSK